MPREDDKTARRKDDTSAHSWAEEPTVCGVQKPTPQPQHDAYRSPQQTPDRRGRASAGTGVQLGPSNLHAEAIALHHDGDIVGATARMKQAADALASLI